MQGVAGASRQTRIRALLFSIRNTLFRRSCRFLILLRFRFFSSAASFCLYLFHGPGFLFPSAEAAAAPLFAFPYHSNLEVLLPAPARAGPFPSHQAYSAPQPAARKKFPNFEKIITDAIAFPPPMTHNGVGFRVIRGRPPAKPPQDTGFCPQGGSQGDSIMAHRNGRQRPHQRVGEYPSAMPLGYGETRNRIETGKEGTKANGAVQAIAAGQGADKCPGVGCF